MKREITRGSDRNQDPDGIRAVDRACFSLSVDGPGGTSAPRSRPAPSHDHRLRGRWSTSATSAKSSRQYVLGPRLIRLGDAPRRCSVYAAALANSLTSLENPNLAMLAATNRVRREHSPASMRMLSRPPGGTRLYSGRQGDLPMPPTRCAKSTFRHAPPHRRHRPNSSPRSAVGQARLRRRGERALCRRCRPRHIVPTRPVGVRTRGPGDRRAYREGRAAVDGRRQGAFRRLELNLRFSWCARRSNAIGDTRTAHRSRARSRSHPSATRVRQDSHGTAA